MPLLVSPGLAQAPGCALLGSQSQRVFSDVAAGSDTECAIHLMTTKGVMVGCGGDRFCPTAAVTRGDMAFQLVSGKYVSDGTSPGFVPGPVPFTDAPRGYALTCWAEQARADGIAEGYGDGTFRLHAKVTRRQMAKMLLRAKHGKAYQPSLPCEPTMFTDITCGNALDVYVCQLQREGITLGCTASPPRYCPDSSVNRKAMAMFIRRTFGWTALTCR